jgi:aminopeptidase-like protein
MNTSDLIEELDFKKAGDGMYKLMEELYPICRSITGEGFRESIRILKNLIPLETNSIASGTETFDWKIQKASELLISKSRTCMSSITVFQLIE